MYIKTNRYNIFDSIEIKESLFKEFSLPNHFHDSYCIGMVTQGIKESIVEGLPYVIHSNSITIVNPYQIHSDTNYDNDSSLYKMIYINKDVIHFFVKKIVGDRKNNITFTNDLITNQFVSNAILCFFDQINDEKSLENKLYGLIKLLIENYLSENKEENYRINKNTIEDSIQHIHSNFSDKIDVNSLAIKSKLSKFQYIRQFKKITGLTPASYIMVCRINYAKYLLTQDFSIGHIALDIGFYDHPQFCKFFKYYTNLSPIEYKKNCNIIQA